MLELLPARMLLTLVNTNTTQLLCEGCFLSLGGRHESHCPVCKAVKKRQPAVSVCAEVEELQLVLSKQAICDASLLAAELHGKEVCADGC